MKYSWAHVAPKGAQNSKRRDIYKHFTPGGVKKVGVNEADGLLRQSLCG